MAKRNDCWGIEVGANAIKAMRLVRDGSDIVLAEYDVLPFKQILTTPDLDVVDQIQLNLDAFMQRHDVSSSTVMVSVPGGSAFARFAKLPPVEPKKVPSIVEYEAQQQIPFQIDQVEWDYQVFQQEDSPEVEVGIFAITKDRVRDILANYRAVGLRVDGMTLSPLAVYNALAHDLDLADEPSGLIIMDICTSSTDLIFVEGGRLFLRTMPIGGNNFTESLMRQFKLSFQRAERLKREAGTSKHARQIFQAMRPVFADLVQEVQKSIGYYQSLNREAELTKLVGVGSTFRLPGMQKFLNQQLQMDVERLDSFKKLRIEGRQESELAEQAMNLTTAYGLALQGLGAEKVTANVLPKQVLKQRIWRAKQPMMLAAASLMLIASLTALGKLIMDRNAFAAGMEGEPNYAAQIEQTLAEARSLESELSSVQGADPRQSMDNALSLLEYRDLWPKITADIGAALLAMNPLDVTLSSNYEAWKQTPRGERNRVFVESWSVDYVAENSTSPGSLVLRITGFHTNTGDGYAFVQSFAEALKDQAEQQGRPYQFVERNMVEEIIRQTIEATPEQTEPDGQQPPEQIDPLSGLGLGMEGIDPLGSSRDRDRGVQAAYAELLPSRPQIDKPTPGSPLTRWNFEVTWELDVLKRGQSPEDEAAAMEAVNGAPSPFGEAP